MVDEQKHKSNNDILDDSTQQEREISYYKSVADKLVDSLWRRAKNPSDSSDRESLVALLKNPKMKTKNKSLIALANLLQDETMGKITQESIEYYSPLSWLPKDVVRTSIGHFLEKKDKAALGATNFGLFRVLYGNLLKHVMNGSETSANILLKIKKPSNSLESSVLQKNTFTDPGGRTFKSISPLQYAYWMRDWYMVDMLLSHLSKEQLEEAQKQINEVRRCNSEDKEDLKSQKGIEYQLYLDIDVSVEVKDFAAQHLAPVIIPQEKVEYHINPPPVDYDYTQAMPIPEAKKRVLVIVKGEKHYDYQPLIKVLKDYLPIYQRWEASGSNDDNLKAPVIYHWCKIVGLVQRYATTFLAQQYCHPHRSFENLKFDETVFKRELNFYDFVNRLTISWFLRASGLGDVFAVRRGGGEAEVSRSGAAKQWGRRPRPAVVAALAAIERLREVSPEKMARVLEKHFAWLSQTKEPR